MPPRTGLGNGMQAILFRKEHFRQLAAVSQQRRKMLAAFVFERGDLRLDGMSKPVLQLNGGEVLVTDPPPLPLKTRCRVSRGQPYTVRVL